MCRWGAELRGPSRAEAAGARRGLPPAPPHGGGSQLHSPTPSQVAIRHVRRRGARDARQPVDSSTQGAAGSCRRVFSGTCARPREVPERAQLGCGRSRGNDEALRRRGNGAEAGAGAREVPARARIGADRSRRSEEASRRSGAAARRFSGVDGSVRAARRRADMRARQAGSASGIFEIGKHAPRQRQSGSLSARPAGSRQGSRPGSRPTSGRRPGSGRQAAPPAAAGFGGASLAQPILDDLGGGAPAGGARAASPRSTASTRGQNSRLGVGSSPRGGRDSGRESPRHGMGAGALEQVPYTPRLATGQLANSAAAVRLDKLLGLSTPAPSPRRKF